MKKLLLILCFLIATGGSLAQATVYTVCHTCDHRSVTEAFSSNDLEPGDIIEVQAATIGGTSVFYSEFIVPGNEDDGASGNPVIIKARDGDTITLSAYKDAVTSEQMRVISANGYADYLSWRNLKFHGGSIATVQIWYQDYNRFENCDFIGGPAYGLYLQDITYFAMEDCTVDGYAANDAVHIGKTDDYAMVGTKLDGVTVTNSATGIEIRDGDFTGGTFNNLHVSNCSGTGISIESAASNVLITNSTTNNNAIGLRFDASSGVVEDHIAIGNTGDGMATNTGGVAIFRRCYTEDNGSAAAMAGEGFTAHSTDQLTLEYCVGINNWNAGVGCTANSGVTIIGGTFIGNGEQKNERNSNIWIDSDGKWVIKNTITKCLDPTRYEVKVTSNGIGATLVSLDYNIYGVKDRFYWDAAQISFATFKANTGGDANSLNTDPLLATTGVSNYRLQDGSPAYNAGTSGVTMESTTDHRGRSVPKNVFYDVGAYESMRVYRAPDIGAYESKKKSVMEPVRNNAFGIPHFIRRHSP